MNKDEKLDNYANGCWAINQKEKQLTTFDIWELVESSTTESLVRMLFPIQSELVERLKKETVSQP